MTDAQKEMILDMRQAGHGYKKIATALGLSANTVKSFFRRNEPAKSNASEAQSNNINNANNVSSEQCKQCGAPITQFKGKKEKLFCSSSCRNAWWNARRASPGRKSVRSIVCSGCGNTFYSNELSRRFCGHACYIAHRNRKEGAT